MPREMPELHEQTLTGSLALRLGSLPACIALGAADIGACQLESGDTVCITWGRNLNKESQKWFVENSHFQPVWVSAFDGRAELVIPDEIANPLLAMLSGADASQAAAAAAAAAARTRLAGNMRWYGQYGPAYRECTTRDGRVVRVTVSEG